MDHLGGAAELGPPEVVLNNLQAVWVLIFNPGRNDEGVYTLQAKTGAASSYVLAFEQTDEVRSNTAMVSATRGRLERLSTYATLATVQANRFAELLQAEGFDLPKPMEWHRDQVTTFCYTGQFDVR